jgi:hypothetical protein
MRYIQSSEYVEGKSGNVNPNWIYFKKPFVKCVFCCGNLSAIVGNVIWMDEN